MYILPQKDESTNTLRLLNLGKRYIANLIFIPALLLVLIISFKSYHQVNEVITSQSWIVHTYQVMRAVDNSLYNIVDIETHQRGFLITGDDQFFIDRQDNLDSLNKSLASLISLTKDNPKQNERSILLSELIHKRLVLLDEVSNLKKTNQLNTKEGLNTFHKNLQVENEIEALGSEIIDIELTLLTTRDTAFINDIKHTNSNLITGSVISIFLIFISFLLSNIAIYKQILAERSRAILAMQLREVIESASDMIAAIDINLRFFIFNDAYQKEFSQIFGKQIEIGMSLDEALVNSPTEKEKIIQSWQSSLKGDESIRTVNFVLDGKNNTYEITANLIKDDENKIIGAIHIIRNITKRVNEDLQLKNAYQATNEAMQDLKKRNLEITALVEMSDLMLACNSITELAGVVSNSCKKILSFASGILYVKNPASNYLDIASKWGVLANEDQSITPEKCWAIRLARTHHAGVGQDEMICEHISHASNDLSYFCVPLMAQNDIYGILYLELSAINTEKFSENEKLLIKAFSELTALALANVRLRENLHYQSVRDPLTSLYNRRYLDEFLIKELYRSERSHEPVAILMVDIDHFKRVNDTYGHEAGDLVLKELSNLLQSDIRMGDIASRFGGEEFILVLYNATAEVAKKRAEALRENVAALSLKYKGEAIGPINISIGIAVYPDDAKTPMDLITCSDKALYVAKNSGRNKVVVYSENIT